MPNKLWVLWERASGAMCASDFDDAYAANGFYESIAGEAGRRALCLRMSTNELKSLRCEGPGSGRLERLGRQRFEKI